MATTRRIRSTQYVLPSEEFERSFALNEERQAFVAAYLVNGNNGRQAVHAARESLGARATSNNYAGKRASQLLDEEEVARAIEETRRFAAMTAALDVTEFNAGLRVLLRQSQGEEAMRETITAISKDGELLKHDVMAYRPSVSGQGKALELLGKAMGLLKDKSEIKHTGSVSLIERLEHARKRVEE